MLDFVLLTDPLFFTTRRERAKKKRYESAKCMYELPPFDPHFDPKIHNKYLARYSMESIKTIKKIENAYKDGILGHQFNKILYSSLLLLEIHSPFCWRILQKTILYASLM